MKNRINLSKYQIRTDLIIENIDEFNDKRVTINNINDSIKVTTVSIDEDLSSKLNKKQGDYVTIEFSDITNHEDRKELEKTLVNEIRKMLNGTDISSDATCLIVGLGNKGSTADSLGPKVVDRVLVTRHLFVLNTNVKDGIREVSAISPGVMATTGIETFDIITSIVKKTKPQFLIVVDALASSSIDRINKTIQLTNTGIHPGSGVGNNRKELSFETINIPVIAIGVPTVVESTIIVNDTIDYLFKHISYIKKNYTMNKLVFTHNKNYLKDVNEEDLSKNEKKEISGMLGELDDNDKKALIEEVLTSLDYNLIVTPKEIDFLIDNLSKVIAKSINKALHDVI